MQRVLSGVQPTGALHLGNYLGAIRKFAALQKDYHCLYCVVDLHALTVWQEPKELLENTRAIAAAYIASGIDPQRSIVFVQSRVHAHAELAWILSCVTRMGWLNRMTQFKEKSRVRREHASVGLFTYPCLMAADILLYRTTHVPVGEDQKQHLELTRDIAHKFNEDFGEKFFPLPEPLIEGSATRVMSLRDGRVKMSKSDPSAMSRIELGDDADMIVRKIRRAKSDADLLPGPEALTKEGKPAPELLQTRPEACNLLSLYAAFSKESLSQVLERFSGRGFAALKECLAEAVVAELQPLSAEIKRLRQDVHELDRMLSVGAEQATALAQPYLRRIQEIVGLHPHRNIP